MATNCGLLSKNFRALTSGIQLWADSERTKKIFNDPHEAAMKLIKTNFNMELKHLRYVQDLTQGQVKSYLARLTELTSKVKGGDLDNSFAKFMYQSSHYGAKDPVVGNLLNDMQASQFKFHANEVQDRTLIKGIHSDLRAESLDRGFQKSSMSRAEKESYRLDEQWIQAMADYKTAEKNNDMVI